MNTRILLRFLVVACIASTTFAYDNNAPHSLLPPLGWSSWVALGPGENPYIITAGSPLQTISYSSITGADHPIFDFCDEFSVKAAADAFVDVGLYDAGYRHFHLDDCWAGGRNETGFLYVALSIRCPTALDSSASSLNPITSQMAWLPSSIMSTARV